MKTIFCSVSVMLVLLFALGLNTVEAAETVKDEVLETAASAQRSSEAVSERAKAVEKIREMLKSEGILEDPLPGFEIKKGPGNAVEVNGVKLENMEARPMAELLVALAQKFYVESEEDPEELAAQQEELARIKETQARNDQALQQQNMMRTQEILRQTQNVANRPPPAIPARPPLRPPAPPSLPPRR